MHIPDGYLGPVTYGGLWAAILPVWFYASRKIKEGMKAAQIPFLALASAFSFVIMMFNIPAPGGTTGHATGGTLIAILLGPWPAVMALSIALVIQAFIFGDGGITAIGANCFNMAFSEVITGYCVYRLISSFKARISNSGRLTTRHLAGAAIGSYIGINVAAFLAAVELGVQPLLHIASDGRPLYSPFAMSKAIPAIMLLHITIFGFVECVITVLALVYLNRSNPELIKG